MNASLPEFVDVGDGDRTLVFLHGLGGGHTNWQPQLAQFSSAYRCIAWTLPGYGTSPAIDELTWPNLSLALARMLDDLGVEQVSVIGLSMGGFIAQQFAADYAGRVDQLVLAGTTAQFGRGSQTFAQQFLQTRLEPLNNGATPADFAPAVVAQLVSLDAPEHVVSNAVATMSQISADGYRQALECLVTWNFVDRLDQIKAPTLCIAAGDDRTSPVAAVQALADGIADARVSVLANCQHLMNLDQPQAFNALVATFLRELR